jgi:pSer/pThr/pTyr-binding forkhead associated (FHA) protein
VKPLATETIVGRAGGDFILNDPAISGQHLKIKLETLGEDEQAFVLYDMASSNGTFAGDRETYQDDTSRVYRHVLQDGDFILVGKTTLVFKQV